LKLDGGYKNNTEQPGSETDDHPSIAFTRGHENLSLIAISITITFGPSPEKVKQNGESLF
jgi:hypothetical protein